MKFHRSMFFFVFFLSLFMVTKKLFLVLFLFFCFGCYFVALIKMKNN